MIFDERRHAQVRISGDLEVEFTLDIVMDTGSRGKIISAYGAHLEAMKSPFGRESDLPYPKELIRQALAEELVSETIPKLIEVTETCFISLEDFVSDDDYLLVQRHEHLLAQRDQILKTEGVEFGVFAKNMADALSPVLAIMDRSLSQKKSRMQQLAAIRALRSGGGATNDVDGYRDEFAAHKSWGS